MYAGQLVEIGPARELLKAPRHPYTRMLLEAVPSMDQAAGALRVIRGEVPDAENPPPGCRFSTRCPHRMDICDRIPTCFDVGVTHGAACWLNAPDVDAEPPSAAIPANHPS
jgi:oligopeptide/dipeptide ABC transporter ATP-binding protein